MSPIQDNADTSHLTGVNQKTERAHEPRGRKPSGPRLLERDSQSRPGKLDPDRKRETQRYAAGTENKDGNKSRLRGLDWDEEITDAVPDEGIMSNEIEYDHSEDGAQDFALSRATEAGEGVGGGRWQQIQGTFMPFITEQKPMPPGTTREIARFLVLAGSVAEVREGLDALDPHLWDVLIGCFGEGLSTSGLLKALPDVNQQPGSIQWLKERGLNKLWKSLGKHQDTFGIDLAARFGSVRQLMEPLRERRIAFGRMNGRRNAERWARAEAERQLTKDGHLPQ